jgi:hypothetical protein
MASSGISAIVRSQRLSQVNGALQSKPVQTRR